MTRELLGPAGDQNVFFVARVNAFDTGRGSHHGAPVAECFENLDAGAAACTNRDHHHVRGSIARFQIGNPAGHVDTCSIGRVEQAAARARPRNLDLEISRPLSANARDNLVAEIARAIVIGIVSQGADEQEPGAAAAAGAWRGGRAPDRIGQHAQLGAGVGLELRPIRLRANINPAEAGKRFALRLLVCLGLRLLEPCQDMVPVGLAERGNAPVRGRFDIVEVQMAQHPRMALPEGARVRRHGQSKDVNDVHRQPPPGRQWSHPSRGRQERKPGLPRPCHHRRAPAEGFKNFRNAGHKGRIQGHHEQRNGIAFGQAFQHRSGAHGESVSSE